MSGTIAVDDDAPPSRGVLERRRRPNIVLILADDLGYSDVSCFGSEIPTPHVDALAYGPCGVRFSQMYNSGRCCPSRAELLTGMHPHQAGVGHMVYDAGVGPAYQGYLRKNVPTISELLRNDSGGGGCGNDKGDGGYATYMAGKWHVGGEYPPDATPEWIESVMGDDSHPTPTQRGFDEFYGTLGGGGSYYRPPSLIDNDAPVTTPEGYYYTDAINDKACRMIESAMGAGASGTTGGGSDDVDSASESASAATTRKPFFLYVAHVAPHWPLHAPTEEINKHRGKYLTGWDELRKCRHARLVELGLVDPSWECSPRDDHAPPWDDSGPRKEWEDARMATYAAQVSIMDQGIGRIVETLKRTGAYNDTAVFFLSDNGGCAEYLKENGEEGHWPEFYGGRTREGREINVGNNPDLMPGGEDTFMSYDLPWANASNAPFRLFKSWVHEGGISTPFVAHWPCGEKSRSRSKTEGSDVNCNSDNEGDVVGRIHRRPWAFMDVAATILDLAGIDIEAAALEGESFLPVLRDEDDARRCRPIFWEHQGNRAVRDGRWKLVFRHDCSEQEREEGSEESSDDVSVEDGWELYDMERDRTELRDLAKKEKERARSMIRVWYEWAERCGVKPWPLAPIPDGERDWSHVPWLW